MAMVMREEDLSNGIVEAHKVFDEMPDRDMVN